MRFIGVDIGTLSTKGLLVDASGQVLSQAVVKQAIQYPAPDWAEQDADRVWWASAVAVIRQLLADSQIQAEEIGAVGISGLFPALLLADDSGRPLRPALLYSDNRAADELEQFNRRFNLALTGDAISPKLAWLRDHEPEVFRRVRYVFSSHNYIVYRLTGSYCVDYKVASSFGGLLDLDQLYWREQIAEWAGLQVERLPHLCSAAAIAGTVNRQASKATGLAAGTPVICGSGDSLMTLLGAGAIWEKDALLSFGTTGWMGVLPCDLEAYFHNPILAKSGAPYWLAVYLLAMGAAVQWFQEQFCQYRQPEAGRLGLSLYQFLDLEAESIPAGAEGVCVLPYFQGRRQVGVREVDSAAILGLNLSHTPAHIYRALLESFGYAVRTAIEDLKEQDIIIKRLIGTGGGAASPLWRQMVCDISGLPMYYHDKANPCLGDAFLAGYALGKFKSLTDIQSWLPKPIVTQPQDDTQNLYNQAYIRFIRLREANSDNLVY
jgi:xylulokinase